MIMRLAITLWILFLALLFVSPVRADDQATERLIAAVERLEAKADALEARIAELEATRCRCEPTPAPMPTPPVEPVANGPAPTRPMPDDGREWAWAMGSHGEYTWITYDPPGHVGDVPDRPQAASSYRLVPQPTYGHAPPPVCHGPGCGAGYRPAPAFAPAPTWGGCTGPNCQRRFP